MNILYRFSAITELKSSRFVYQNSGVETLASYEAIAEKIGKNADEMVDRLGSNYCFVLFNKMTSPDGVLSQFASLRYSDNGKEILYSHLVKMIQNKDPRLDDVMNEAAKIDDANFRVEINANIALTQAELDRLNQNTNPNRSMNPGGSPSLSGGMETMSLDKFEKVSGNIPASAEAKIENEIERKANAGEPLQKEVIVNYTDAEVPAAVKTELERKLAANPGSSYEDITYQSKYKVTIDGQVQEVTVNAIFSLAEVLDPDGTEVIVYPPNRTAAEIQQEFADQAPDDIESFGNRKMQYLNSAEQTEFRDFLSIARGKVEDKLRTMLSGKTASEMMSADLNTNTLFSGTSEYNINIPSPRRLYQYGVLRQLVIQTVPKIAHENGITDPNVISKIIEQTYSDQTYSWSQGTTQKIAFRRCWQTEIFKNGGKALAERVADAPQVIASGGLEDIKNHYRTDAGMSPEISNKGIKATIEVVTGRGIVTLPEEYVSAFVFKFVRKSPEDTDNNLNTTEYYAFMENGCGVANNDNSGNPVRIILEEDYEKEPKKEKVFNGAAEIVAIDEMDPGYKGGAEDYRTHMVSAPKLDGNGDIMHDSNGNIIYEQVTANQQFADQVTAYQNFVNRRIGGMPGHGTPDAAKLAREALSAEMGEFAEIIRTNDAVVDVLQKHMNPWVKGGLVGLFAQMGAGKSKLKNDLIVAMGIADEPDAEERVTRFIYNMQEKTQANIQPSLDEAAEAFMEMNPGATKEEFFALVSEVQGEAAASGETYPDRVAYENLQKNQYFDKKDSVKLLLGAVYGTALVALTMGIGGVAMAVAAKKFPIPLGEFSVGGVKQLKPTIAADEIMEAAGLESLTKSQYDVMTGMGAFEYQVYQSLQSQRLLAQGANPPANWDGTMDVLPGENTQLAQFASYGDQQQMRAMEAEVEALLADENFADLMLTESEAAGMDANYSRRALYKGMERTLLKDGTENKAFRQAVRDLRNPAMNAMQKQQAVETIYGLMQREMKEDSGIGVDAEGFVNHLVIARWPSPIVMIREYENGTPVYNLYRFNGKGAKVERRLAKLYSGDYIDKKQFSPIDPSEIKRPKLREKATLTVEKFNATHDLRMELMDEIPGTPEYEQKMQAIKSLESTGIRQAGMKEEDLGLLNATRRISRTRLLMNQMADFRLNAEFLTNDNIKISRYEGAALGFFEQHADAQSVFNILDPNQAQTLTREEAAQVRQIIAMYYQPYYGTLESAGAPSAIVGDYEYKRDADGNIIEDSKGRAKIQRKRRGFNARMEDAGGLNYNALHQSARENGVHPISQMMSGEDHEIMRKYMAELAQGPMADGNARVRILTATGREDFAKQGDTPTYAPVVESNNEVIRNSLPYGGDISDIWNIQDPAQMKQQLEIALFTEGRTGDEVNIGADGYPQSSIGGIVLSRVAEYTGMYFTMEDLQKGLANAEKGNLSDLGYLDNTPRVNTGIDTNGNRVNKRPNGNPRIGSPEGQFFSDEGFFIPMEKTFTILDDDGQYKRVTYEYDLYLAAECTNLVLKKGPIKREQVVSPIIHDENFVKEVKRISLSTSVEMFEQFIPKPTPDQLVPNGNKVAENGTEALNNLGLAINEGSFVLDQEVTSAHGDAVTQYFNSIFPGDGNVFLDNANDISVLEGLFSDAQIGQIKAFAYDQGGFDIIIGNGVSSEVMRRTLQENAIAFGEQAAINLIGPNVIKGVADANDDRVTDPRMNRFTRRQSARQEQQYKRWLKSADAMTTKEGKYVDPEGAFYKSLIEATKDKDSALYGVKIPKGYEQVFRAYFQTGDEAALNRANLFYTAEELAEIQNIEYYIKQNSDYITQIPEGRREGQIRRQLEKAQNYENSNKQERLTRRQARKEATDERPGQTRLERTTERRRRAAEARAQREQQRQQRRAEREQRKRERGDDGVDV